MRRIALIVCTLLCVCADAAERRVLIVATSHAVLGDTGKATGAWLPEIAHPWHALRQAGIAVDLASPAGGRVPIDPGSDPRANGRGDEMVRAFLAEGVALIETSQPLAEVKGASYDAILIAGGTGAVFDLPGHAGLQALVAEAWGQGKVVAALCHGTAALLDVRLADGTWLVAGKKLTGFTNAEEARVLPQAETILPFLIETRAKERGADFQQREAFAAFTVVDGRLITGQQNNSGRELGRRLVEALKP